MRLLLFIFVILSIGYSFAEGGFYLGIGAGYSGISNIPQGGFTFNGQGGSQNAGAFTPGIYGGYDFNRIVGLQVDYDVAFSGQAPTYTVNQQLLDGVVLLHLPFGIFADALNGFSLFAKGGLGYSAYTFNNQSANCATCVNPPSNAAAFVPVYGIGAEYGFNSIGVRAEWTYSGNVTAPNIGYNQVQLNSNLYFLSILYHF